MQLYWVQWDVPLLSTTLQFQKDCACWKDHTFPKGQPNPRQRWGGAKKRCTHWLEMEGPPPPTRTAPSQDCTEEGKMKTKSARNSMARVLASRASSTIATTRDCTSNQFLHYYHRNAYLPAIAPIDSPRSRREMWSTCHRWRRVESLRTNTPRIKPMWLTQHLLGGGYIPNPVTVCSHLRWDWRGSSLDRGPRFPYEWWRRDFSPPN